MSPIDQTELDRFVDDECDEATRRAILARVASTESWQQLALTFVEAQTLRRDLRRLFQTPEPVAWASSPCARAAVPEPIQSQTERRNPRFLFVKAFSLIILFLLMCRAWLIQKQHNDPRRAQPQDIVTIDNIHDQPTTAELPVPARVTTNTDLPQSVQFVVNDGQSDVPRYFEIPVQNTSAPLDVAQWQPQSVLTEEMRRSLANSGHEIEEDASLLPVTLPNGRSVAFPVHQVRVKYRGPQWHQ